MTKAEIWKASDTTIRRAIRGSVRKWIKIVEGRGLAQGVDNCPLCEIFWGQDDCAGCPIEALTGCYHCEETPHVGWAAHWCERCRRQDVTIGSFPDCRESLALVKAELRFLAGFVPAREKLHAKVKVALVVKLKDTRVRALRKSS